MNILLTSIKEIGHDWIWFGDWQEGVQENWMFKQYSLSFRGREFNGVAGTP